MQIHDIHAVLFGISFLFFSSRQKYIFKTPKLFFVPVLNTSHCNRTQLFIVPQFSFFVLWISWNTLSSFLGQVHIANFVTPYRNCILILQITIFNVSQDLSGLTLDFLLAELVRLVSICVFFQKKTASEMIWKTFKLIEFVFRLFIKFKIPV